MPMIEIKDGVLSTSRFGDRVNVGIPEGGRVEIQTADEHVDVQIRTSTGAVKRTFRLPKENRR